MIAASALAACGGSAPRPAGVSTPRPPPASTPQPVVAVEPLPCRSAAGVAFASPGDFHCVRPADLRPPICRVYVRGEWYTFDQARIDGRIGCREAIGFEFRFTQWLDHGPGKACLDSLCAGTHPQIAGYRCQITDVGDDVWDISCRAPGKLVLFGTAG